MTPRRLAVVLLAAAGLAWASNAQAAPDRVGHLSIGVMAAASSNDFANNAAFYQANFDYGVTPYIALGMEGGWEEAGGNGSDENIGVVPIFVDIIVRSPEFHDNLVPYGVLGLGVVGAYAQDSEGNEPDNSGADSSEVSFGWKIGLGVEYLMDPHWAVYLEAAYINSTVSLPTAQESTDRDIQYWTFGAGAKHIF